MFVFPEYRLRIERKPKGVRRRIFVNEANKMKVIGARLSWMCYHQSAVPDGLVIDHINGDTMDDSYENLRACTSADNSRNRMCNSNLLIPGIVVQKNGLYTAYIGFNYRSIRLGLFDDFFEACCARKSAENKLGFHENHGRQA